MATKYFCDRCGNSFDDKNEIKELKYEFEGAAYYQDNVIIKKDLCRSCAKLLLNWIVSYITERGA